MQIEMQCDIICLKLKRCQIKREDIMEYSILKNGVKIPMIGFGTWIAVKEDSDIVLKAIEAGYRLIDTAAFYDNEEQIGESLQKSCVPREELFLTSKVWKTNLGYDKTIRSFERSLKNLKTDYLDLFLIHWPKNHLDTQDWIQEDQDTWRAMEMLYKAGKIRAIGLSNFYPHHMIPLLENAEIKPMVNQIEFHPGFTQKYVTDYCKENDMIVEAWSPLGRAAVLSDEVICNLAEKYGRTPAQICLRFTYQCGIVSLPKASSMIRMHQNLEIFDFEISNEDMSVIYTLPQTGWSGEHPDRRPLVDLGW